MKVIFRIWVDGKLVLTEDYDGDGETLEELSRRHQALVDGENRPWLVELEMPELPEPERFYRFGTDRHGMVSPIDMSRRGEHPWAQ